MTSVTRRTVLKAAALGTTALSVPFVHGAHAAGKLSCGFWDHWVPGANEPLTKLCNEWAAKEKVELTNDFITSNGDKDKLTIAAEAQAKAGHDLLSMQDWYAPAQTDNLEPVDDVVAELIKEHGEISHGSQYLGKQRGHWIAVPTGIRATAGTPCARMDLMKQHAGVDVRKMYPAGAPPDKELADKWDWDLFLI